MLAVLTSASYSVAILPEFVRHYAKLGMESIHISVLELTSGFKDEVDRVGATCCLPVKTYPASDIWKATKMEAQNKNELRALLRLSQKDWYVPADLDEFIEFGEPVPSLILRMGTHGYAMGSFSDRVSLDGSLTEYDPSRSIWEQYPRQLHVTRDVMGLNYRKVVLARGHLGVTSGHHRILHEEHSCIPYEFPIHHFAWRAGRLEALRVRRENYVRLGIDCSPLLRLMDHVALHKGKLSVGSD